MQVEDGCDRDPSGVPDDPAAMAETDSGATDVRIKLALLAQRLTGVESDLAALETGISVIETRLTGIENRQRHAETRHERIGTRFSELDFGVDRVHAHVAALEGRVRHVELDLRELSGASCRGSSRDGDALRPLNCPVGQPAGFKGS